MIVKRVRWRGYRVPFREPFVTAHGMLAAREGLLVTIETDSRIVGLGEIAPLPGFGGTAADASRVLPAAAARVIGRRLGKTSGGLEDGDALSALSLALPMSFRPGEAAVRCGLEMALLDAWAKERGVSVAELLAEIGQMKAGGAASRDQHPAVLNADAGRPRGAAPTTAATQGLPPAGNVQRRQRMPVNATIGAVGPEVAAQKAAAAVAAGFGTIKLKATAETDPAAEAARLAAVRAPVGPAVRLRLDANGAWSVDQAIDILRACEPYGLEYVEQPVAADDVDGLRRVRDAVPVVVAADEAATDRDAVARLLAAGAVGAIILKPMAAGGLLEGLAMARLAREAGVLTVVTSTLETGISVAAAAQLAAALPGPLPACGLATAGLLASDLLVSSLAVRSGALLLPEGLGLGVALDDELVARHATAVAGGAEADL